MRCEAGNAESLVLVWPLALLLISACTVAHRSAANGGGGGELPVDSGQLDSGAARDAAAKTDAGSASAHSDTASGEDVKGGTGGSVGGHGGNPASPHNDDLDSGVPDASTDDPRAAILRSTPGRTGCGLKADCASFPEPSNNADGESYCCATLPGDGPPFCSSMNLGACESGNPYYCDEAADCAPGLHCCQFYERTLYRCQASCEGLVQLCKTDAECENGQSCTAYMCGKQPLATCGPLPSIVTHPSAPGVTSSCSLVP